MSEDYAKGFKDGFAAGLEEGKKLNEKSYMDGLIEGMKKTMPPPYNPNPSWSLYGTSDVRGAVGSDVNYPYPPGANGPTGSMYDGPEYANKIWINGVWAELGN